MKKTRCYQIHRKEECNRKITKKVSQLEQPGQPHRNQPNHNEKEIKARARQFLTGDPARVKALNPALTARGDDTSANCRGDPSI